MSSAAANGICCAYCGLPTTSSNTDVAYCCFGCRLAHAMQAPTDEGAIPQRLLVRLGLAIFLTLNVFVCTMVLWSEDIYGMDGGVFAQTLHGLLRYGSMMLAAPVLWLLGVPLLEHVLEQTRARQWTTDNLLLSGVMASYVFSVVSTVRGMGHVYFEVGCVILVLVTLGRWLEANGRAHATAALANLEKLLPETVRVDVDGRLVDRALDDVQPGDRLVIRAGERIPCDGMVLDHAIEVDEQVVTGESDACIRDVGGQVWSGTLNLTDTLRLQVERPPAQGLLPRLVQNIRAALGRKNRFERLADRLAGVFMPLVILTSLTAGVWHGMERGPDAGILAGLAVAVIACPCALAIATPLATWTAIGIAGEAGVLFRESEALERLSKARAFRFDKTGTLTTGRPRVIGIELLNEADRETALAMGWSMTRDARHVHAHAIHAAVPRPDAPISLTEPLNHVGRGLAACHPIVGPVYLGSARFLREHGQCLPPQLEAQLETETVGPVVLLGWGGAAKAVFRLAEELRLAARETLQTLQNDGMDVAVLTGDRQARAHAMARELGVPVLGELLPEDKVSNVHEAQRRFGPVVMVGDGLNDAAALAASDVGMALGCGTDLTRETASVCLLSNDLSRLRWLLRLARQTVRTIRINLFWACAYNVLGIGLACTGRLNPIWAALAMTISSALVVGNSLRLRRETARQPAAEAAMP